MGTPCTIRPTKKDISFTVPFRLITLGPPLPRAMDGLSMLEIHGDAFVFGGSFYKTTETTQGWSRSSAIYQITCSSGVCSWSTLNQELKVSRDETVAIPVPGALCL